MDGFLAHKQREEHFAGDFTAQGISCHACCMHRNDSPMRKLKYHEQRLLRKVNFLEWKGTNTKREQLITSKYNLLDREDYARYNKLAGKIKKLALALARLPEDDEMKSRIGKELVHRLYSMGFIKEKKLYECSKITVANMCNRRLPVMMKHIKMVTNITDATKFVEHGHVKVGGVVVKDPSAMISREVEEYVTWVDSSKIKKKIEEFNTERDDFKYV